MRLVFLLNADKIFKFLGAFIGLNKLNKAFLPLFVLLMAQGFSQSDPGKWVGSNEVKLNIFYLPGGYPELSYERILGNKSAVGISVGFFIDSAGPNYTTDILTFDKAVFPYYRYYFGQRRAAGFFVESNAIIFSRASNIREEKETGWGLGLAFGIKLVMKSNWNVDLITGGGVNVNKGNSNLDGYLNFPDLYPRLGISIGKRF